VRNHPYLKALTASGIRLGLGRVSGFLKEIGSPHRCAPMVHVAGTNGKGSVCSMVDCMLQEAGYKTGMTLSPHLQQVNERIRIDGQSISDADLQILLSDLELAIQNWASKHLQLAPDTLPLTYFEAMIAAAFLHFERSNVGVGVVEVGLGGRLDATCVVTPAVSAVVSIGLDHTDRLGPDVASVAYEKAGVFRGGVPAVVGDLPPAAMLVIRDTAASKGAPLFVAGEDFRIVGQDEIFSWEMGSVRIDDLQLRLQGRFQRTNAAVALAIVELLERGGIFSIPHTARRRGLARAQHAGRLEWLGPDLLVDGAHNIDAAKVLADHLSRLPRDRRRTLVLGLSADKDMHMIAAALAPQFDRILTTRCAHPRAAEPEAVARALETMDLPVVAAGSIEEALPLAQVNPGLVVVAGSLYLAGAVRDLVGKA
jgi:dihydrofolate synthase/folylpolyglutamate synthase